ncbi:hypothetical protein [Streptomyces sp. S.PNR 29]|uniref:hypothetical protein n=1 Tax=Streptomyces sp. S.PNR 29 TaxID=2973805 RepID=UPI0025B03B37|nr:hypothetical protein [Streptomyces sp. S.PNR 29]MDN0198477.1 hypothetical protein [Streptomyces sp. S.PNR 29]
MSSTPRSVDEVLSRARVFQGEYTHADLEAARHAIARELDELRRVLRPAGAPSPAGRPVALHDRAARDLRTLCRGTIRHPGAAEHVTAFDTTRDPDGALAFACLLHLADEEEGAQFWWQYAAGAGNVTGALCLYLLHLSRGELRDAEHWANQVSDLNELDWSEYRPVEHRAEPAGADPLLGTAVRYTLPPGQGVPEAAVKDAVAQLDAPDAGLGPIPQPTADLAVHWHVLVPA